MIVLRTKTLPAGEPDYAVVMIITTLLALGLLMVYSASYVWAVETDLHSSYYFVRQCMWAGLGLVGAFVMFKVDHRRWQRWAPPIMAAVLLALGLVLVAGQSRFGAVSSFFAGSVQPSELAKMAMIIYLATWLSSKGEKLRDVSYGLLPFGVLLGLVAGLIVMEPDLGAAMVIVAIAIAMFFLAGAEPKQVAISLLAGGITAVLLFMTSGNAQQRVSDFMALIRDPQQGGHPHVRLALQALSRGGLFGTGIPGGIYKELGGVPLPFSDSIFPILGEEMGLVGTWLVLALFGLLGYRGFRIARRAHNDYGMLLAAGVTCWFVFQAVINIAVNTALAPYTGLTLPFISHGGSSLVSCMAGVGLLLNVSRYATDEAPGGVASDEAVAFGRGHRGTRLPSARGVGGMATPVARRRWILLRRIRMRRSRRTAGPDRYKRS